MKTFTLDDLPRVVRRKRRSPENLWGEIAYSLNPAYTQPRLASDIEVAEFTYRSGEPYTMIKAPRGPSYMRLNEEDKFVLDQIDGRNSVKDIVVAHFQRFGYFALSTVTGLIEELRRAGFLAEPYVSIEKTIADAKRDKGPGWLVRLRRIREKKRLDMPRPHELTDWMYRHGGRLLFTKAANVIFVAVTVIGVILAWRLLGSARFSLFGTSAASILALYLISLLTIFIHEGAHALSVRHFDRRVNAAGFMFYLGMPLFFIETTDTWMSNRRQRVLASWSGPYSGFIIGGICAIAATVMPTNAISAFLYRFAIFSYYGTLQNLVPFLRLDGYYIMMDLIDTQNLRERSFAFMRYELLSRIRTHTKLTRHEKALTAYGVIATAFAILAILLALAFWGRVFKQPVITGWNAGWGTRLLIIGLGVLILAAPLRALARLIREIVRRGRFVWRLAVRASQARWRADAAMLARDIPLLAGLDDEARRELVAHLTLRRVPSGRAVVTEGEQGSEFFIVRSGRLEVVRADADGHEIEAQTLERGATFGEIALLQAGPRTATVRANQASEVFALDKGTFDRLLASRIDVGGLESALMSVRELRGLKPFSGLDAHDAAEVLRHAAWMTVRPKTAVVRQGETPDGFYVIGSGQFQVVKDRKVIGTLGPGDYFGEIALLQDSVRTATVRSVTPSRVLKLDRSGFDAVLAAAFARGALDASAHLVREWEH